MPGRYKPPSEIAPSIELISERYQLKSPVEARSQLFILTSEGVLDEWRKQIPDVVQQLEEKAMRADTFCLEQAAKGNLQARTSSQTLAQGNCKVCRNSVIEYQGEGKDILHDLIQVCKSDAGNTFCKTVYDCALSLLKAQATQSSS